MARIRTYTNDESIDTGDQLLGTDVIGGNTSNFTIEALASFLAQTGDADPSKIGFQFNYVGQNTDVVNLVSTPIHIQMSFLRMIGETSSHYESVQQIEME